MIDDVLLMMSDEMMTGWVLFAGGDVLCWTPSQRVREKVRQSKMAFEVRALLRVHSRIETNTKE